MRPKLPPDDTSAGTESSNSEFGVQISESLKSKAEEMAKSEGISLEDFILYAVAEKIARSESPKKI